MRGEDQTGSAFADLFLYVREDQTHISERTPNAKVREDVNRKEEHMKIDVSTIEGYQDMTAEQKLQALEAYEIADPDYTGYVRKEQFDKASSEVAEWKKKYNAKLSDDEKAENARKQMIEDMETELNALRRDKNISAYTADFLSLGYEEKLAKETAEAMADGDFSKVFANQKKFKADFEKTIRTEILGSTPRPDETGGTKNVTKAEFLKMPYEKQREYIKDHPNYQNELK